MSEKLLFSSSSPLNHSLLSNGFTAGTPKFRGNFDPAAADVVRAANDSEDSIVNDHYRSYIGNL
jgi:hypothetical protein